MKRILILALVLAAACDAEPPAASDTSAARTPIAVEYVRADKLQVRERPFDDSTIIATYDNGESVSVLSHRGAWDEIRTASGSGWVHANDLADALEAKKIEADNTSVRFRVPPEPVLQPGATGEIVLEASVNSDGEVLDVKTISNTTGSASLEARSAAALRRARFLPMVRHGKRIPFTYTHTVHY